MLYILFQWYYSAGSTNKCLKHKIIIAIAFELLELLSICDSPPYFMTVR